MADIRRVTTQDPWWLTAPCSQLTSTQADAIFFPGSGGKPTKAKMFCSMAKCPVQAKCLTEAIENKLEGFYAGTTQDEREVMARQWHIKPTSLNDAVKALVEKPEPKDGKRRAKYLHVVTTPVGQSYDELDSMDFPELP